MIAHDTRPDLLDIPQSAAYLNVTDRWIRRAVAERRIAHVRSLRRH